MSTTSGEPLEPLTPERRRQQTRQHLLAAAAEVFAAHGYHGASLEEVARAAGFTKGAVYSNFASKEELFVALADEHLASVLARTRDAMEGSEVPPAERLEEFARIAADNLAEERADQALMLEFWLYAARHPGARAKWSEHDRTQAEAVAAMMEDVPGIDTLAWVVVALFHGIALLALLSPERADGELMAEAVRLISARAAELER